MTAARSVSTILLLPLALAAGSACRGGDDVAPAILAVEPGAIPQRVPATISVLGRGFFAAGHVDAGEREPVEVERRFIVTVGETVLSGDAVRCVDTETLLVTAPPGLPDGTHDVRVLTPRGLSAVLPQALTVFADERLTLSIEDASGGEGTRLDSRTLIAGSVLRLFAVLREPGGRFVADAQVSWSIDGSIGAVETGPSSSMVFEARHSGIGQVVAALSSEKTSALALAVVAAAPVRLVIEDEGAGLGQARGDGLVATADELLPLHAVARDAYGNFVADVAALWTSAGELGALSRSQGASTVLDVQRVGRGAVLASYGALPTAVLRLEARPGVPGSLDVVDARTGLPVAEGLALSVSGEDCAASECRTGCRRCVLRAVARDADGNAVSDVAVRWSALGAQLEPTGMMAGEVIVTATSKGDDVLTASLASPSLWTTLPFSVGLCGDRVLDTGELCDGDDFGSASCLPLGLLSGGGGGARCATTCAGLELSGCAGGMIDGVEQLEAALREAHAFEGHETIALHPGVYSALAPIVVDECADGCVGGAPFGVTLQPLEGVVVFDGSQLGDTPLFEIVTGDNVFRDVRVFGARAMALRAGARAGGNTIERMSFEHFDASPAGEMVRVESDGNSIQANRFLLDATSGPGGYAVVVERANHTRVVMNVIRGAFASAISLVEARGINSVDHNSVWLLDVEGAAGDGVSLVDTRGLCFRNNLLVGTWRSTGLVLDRVSLAPVGCGARASENNATTAHAFRCRGRDCEQLCADGGPFCDRNEEPIFTSSSLCLAPESAELVDSGVSVGYDLWDDSPSDFRGLAPEIGAREAGTSRRFGGEPSMCPAL